MTLRLTIPPFALFLFIITQYYIIILTTYVWYRYLISSASNSDKIYYYLMALTKPQIQSLLAGFICMLIYGSAYTYGTLIPYVTSYIYLNSDESITTNKMASLLLISIFVLNVGMPLCNLKQLQFSNRITTLISILGVCLSILVISFGDSYAAYLIIYGIFFGLFIGFGYLAPIKNCYLHIPHLKGLCSGVCILGYGISSLLFNMILLALINPNNISSIVMTDGKKIYPPEVANNVPSALRIISAVYLGIGLIGVALMSPPAQVLEGKKSNETSSQMSMAGQPLLSRKELSGGELVQIMIKKKIIWLVATLSCSIPFGMFIAFNYKQYGMLKIHDKDSFLTIIGSCGAVFNGLGRLFWGALLDRLSFRVISALINGLLLITSLTVSFLIENENLFLVAVSVIYFCYGGNYSIYPTHTVRIFGQQLGGKIYYVVFTGFSIGCAIQWLSRLLLVPESPEDAKFDGFTLCFYIFAGLNLISLLLSLFIKYDFEEQPNANEAKKDIKE